MPTKSKSEIKREAAQKPVAEEVVEAPPVKIGEAVKPEDVMPEAEPSTVTIKSADGRTLECSINGIIWEGKEITVPKELEGDVRRLLEDGGFYVKN